MGFLSLRDYLHKKIDLLYWACVTSINPIRWVETKFYQKEARWGLILLTYSGGLPLPKILSSFKKIDFYFTVVLFTSISSIRWVETQRYK